MMGKIEDIGTKVVTAIILLMVAVLIVIFLSSLAKTYNTPEGEIITENRYIQKRYIDQDAGVVCYLFSNGISCLPISQTELEQ